MDNNSKSGNNFLSGFLLGAFVGAAVVLLLATKKGKKILKAISEEGEGKISNILDKIEHSVDLENESLEDPSFAKASTFANASADRSAGKGNSQTKKEIVAEERPKARRFFRGISRHVN